MPKFKTALELLGPGCGIKVSTLRAAVIDIAPADVESWLELVAERARAEALEMAAQAAMDGTCRACEPSCPERGMCKGERAAAARIRALAAEDRTRHGGS
jgi:hypothetical protein